MKKNKKKQFYNVLLAIFCLLIFTACHKEHLPNNMSGNKDTTKSTLADTIVKTPPKDTTKTIDTLVTPPSDTSNSGLTYLALGDSYTIGQSVAAQDRFPAQTVSILSSAGLKVNNPQYIATTGWTTFDLMYAINDAKPSNNFDIVTLLIGVNDQYQHKQTATYGQRFEALLNTAIILAKGNKDHVFVLSIPDYSATPFVSEQNKTQVSNEIALFNETNKQVADKLEVAYIDITPISENALTDPSLIAGDSLHPSGKQYNLWAKLLEPVVYKALK